MQFTFLAILAAVAVFLALDDNAKKTELVKIQSNVADLQGQLNNQQQVAQSAETIKLQQQMQQLTQERDRAVRETQQLTGQERDRLARVAEQQVAQSAETIKLQQQIQQLTQERDRAVRETQQLTAQERDRLARAAEQLAQARDRTAQEQQQALQAERERAAREIARARATPQPTQAGWLQQRVGEKSKLDSPATPVGQRSWVDSSGVRHYYD